VHLEVRLLQDNGSLKPLKLTIGCPNT